VPIMRLFGIDKDFGRHCPPYEAMVSIVIDHGGRIAADILWFDQLPYPQILRPYRCPG